MLKNSLRWSTQAGKMSMSPAKRLLIIAVSSMQNYSKPRSPSRPINLLDVLTVALSTDRLQSRTTTRKKCSTVLFQGFRTLSLSTRNLVEHGSQRRHT